MTPAQIDQVRRFHRLVTQRAGALDDHFLGRDRPLGHSRVLFEIGAAGADLRELRARLGLDSGYLSRIVQNLENEGLVVLRSADADERVRRAALTSAGRAEVALMNRRSDEAAQSILAPLTDAQRERLVAAMADVHGLLRVAGARNDRVDPASEHARWCLSRYYAEIAARFEGGFDPANNARYGDDDFRPPRGVFIVANVDGEPVACGGITTVAAGIGYLKRMWVSDSMRGLGFGRRMLGAFEDESRRLRHHTLRLETNRALSEAIQLYDSAGYRRVEPFNDEVYAHVWFEKRLD